MRSKRRTLAIEITANGVVVRAPMKVSKEEIDLFFKKYEPWVEKRLPKIKEKALKNQTINLREKELRLKAKEVIPPMVEKYSKLMGLYPNSVKITSAKTRFGSCSSKKTICFSWRLLAFPEKAIEYVVVHELAHLKYLNHSKNFYRLIENFLPDYKERIQLLK